MINLLVIAKSMERRGEKIKTGVIGGGGARGLKTYSRKREWCGDLLTT